MKNYTYKDYNKQIHYYITKKNINITDKFKRKEIISLR